MRRLLIVLFAVLAACSSDADVGQSTTTATATTATTSASTTTGDDPALTATSTAPAAPDPAVVEQTCAALASERAVGREAALDDFYRGNPDALFVDWLGPLYADCEQQFANHAASQSIHARVSDIRSIGYAGLAGCTESPATAVLRNRNGFSVAVVAFAQGEQDGGGWGWGYSFVEDLPANTELPVEIPWSVPRPGQGCGLYTRAWIVDDSSATATLHRRGDAPDAGLPDGAPPLSTAGENVEEVVQSLLEFEAWLYANPDPALVEEIVDVRAVSYVEFEAYLEELVEDDAWWEVSTPLISAEVLAELDDNTWMVEYQTGPGGFSFHDDGEVSRESTYEWRKRLGVIRRSTYDGRWRWVAESFTIDEHLGTDA